MNYGVQNRTWPVGRPCSNRRSQDAVMTHTAYNRIRHNISRVSEWRCRLLLSKRRLSRDPTNPSFRAFLPVSGCQDNLPCDPDSLSMEQPVSQPPEEASLSSALTTRVSHWSRNPPRRHITRTRHKPVCWATCFLRTTRFSYQLLLQANKLKIDLGCITV
jgi:hypothetical protein